MPPHRRAAVLLALLLPGCLHAPGPSRALAPPPLEIPAGEDPQRWASEIEEFRRQDREAPFAPRGVVFVGSSSIRLWSTLAADMAPIPVLNRGFGGSKLFDAIWWAEPLVDVHAPSLVVVFSGTNDIAGEDPKSAAQVRDLFRQLVARLRAVDARLTIATIAITPTLARERHIAIVREANRLIRTDCEADPRLEFIDPTAELMSADGRPDPQWFREDRLHLNARGYEIWTRHVRPVVERLYERERARP